MPVNVDTKSLAGEYLPNVYVSEISIKEGGLLRSKKKERQSVEVKPSLKKPKGKAPSLKQKKRQAPTPKGLKTNKTDKVLTVQIDMIIRDVIEKDTISTWMANSDFTKFLKIKIIQSTSPRLSKVLSRGKFSAIKLPKFKKHHEVRIISVQKNNFDLKDYTKIHSSDGERIYEIPYQTKMLVKDRKPEHLCYFAYVFLDIQDMAKSYGLNFGPKKVFKGNVTKEEVISDRQVNTTAYIYYLAETNQIWLGKVHRRDGKWFTGTKRDKIVQALRRQKISNGKIKDYRDIEELNVRPLEIKPALKAYQKVQKRQLNRDMPPPRTSPSYISQGIVSPRQSGDTTIMFHVDIRKWIREQSAFGAIIENSTSKRAIEEIYLLSKINQLKILRRRIDKTSSINRLGTVVKSIDFDPSRQVIETIIYSSDNRGFLKKKRTSTGAIREIQNLAFTNNVRTFTVEDNSMKDVTDGLYQYGVEIEAVDGTVVFLNKKLNRLIAAKKQLDLYYNDAICPKYVLGNGKFKPTLAKKYKNLRKKPWVAAIAVFIDVYSSIGRLPRSQKIMSKKLFALTNPTTGTEAGIYGLLSMMQQLIEQMIRALGSKRQQSYSLNTKMSIGSTSTSKASGGAKLSNQYKVSTLTINKFFNDTHDSNIPKNFGVDFVGKTGVQDIGTKAILFSDFSDRISQENSIYWKNSLAESKNLLESESNEAGESQFSSDASPILDLEAVEYGYLTPSTVAAGPITLDRMDAGENIWSPEQYNMITSTAVAINSGSPATTNTSTMTRPTSNEESETMSMTRPDDPYTKTTIKNGNSIGKQASDASKNNILAQLGVTIVETTEDSLEEFSSLSTASKKKLLISVDNILDPNDPLNTISEEPCNNHLADNEEIKERKRQEVKKRNSENKSAVADVFINNLASSGIFNPTNTSQSSPFTQPTIMPIENYDLSTSKNVVDSIRKSPLKKRQIEGIPNQMRSLMFSRSNATKNNWLDQNQDAIKSPETSQMMRYNYGTFGKIEVFMGFEKDKNGDNIILKPKFRMLNKSIVKRAKGRQIICRIENYKNKDLGIGQNSLDMRIFDNCFIMSPSEAIAMANKSRSISRKEEALESQGMSLASSLLTGIPGAEITIGTETWKMSTRQQEVPQTPVFSKETEVSDEQYNKLAQYVDAVEVSDEFVEKYDKDYETKTDQIVNKKDSEEETLEDTIGPSVEEEVLLQIFEEDEMVQIDMDFPNSSPSGERDFTDDDDDDEETGLVGFLPGGMGMSTPGTGSSDDEDALFDTLDEKEDLDDDLNDTQNSLNNMVGQQQGFSNPLGGNSGGSGSGQNTFNAPSGPSWP